MIKGVAKNNILLSMLKIYSARKKCKSIAWDITYVSVASVLYVLYFGLSIVCLPAFDVGNT